MALHLFIGLLVCWVKQSHYGIMVLDGGKDKEYSHKIDGKSCGNTLCLSPVQYHMEYNLS